MNLIQDIQKELKALEECEAIEYVIEKYKLSESYKQNRSSYQIYMK